MSVKAFINAAAKMPDGVRHKLPDQEFDADKSELLNYLASLPEARDHLYELAYGRGVIEFDKERGVWKGVRSTLPL